MSLTLHEIATLVGGQLQGDANLVIHDAATIRDAASGQITLAEGDKAFKQLATCQASAVIVGKLPGVPAIPYIQVDNVHAAFAKVVARFRPVRTAQRVGISPAATISPTAKIADNVEIHPRAVIGDDVQITSGVTIHSGAVIMAGCRIGAGTTIYPNVVLYENTIVGEHCLLHAGCVIGANGFGYSVVQGRHELSAQLGYVELASRVEIGACTTIDRGTYGATYIGEGTKIDNQVQIGHNCRLGKHNLICAQVGLAGSCSTGDYVVMAGQVGIRDHVHIHDGVRLGAKAGVMTDIPAGSSYVGVPAVPEREHFGSLHGFAKLPEMRREFKKLQRDVQTLLDRDKPDEQRDAA